MFATVRSTKFPQTYRALFGFCVRTNALRTAMFDMSDSENPYAFNALFRCFCEHYLKFTYVLPPLTAERRVEARIVEVRLPLDLEVSQSAPARARTGKQRARAHSADVRALVFIYSR